MKTCDERIHEFEYDAGHVCGIHNMDISCDYQVYAWQQYDFSSCLLSLDKVSILGVESLLPLSAWLFPGCKNTQIWKKFSQINNNFN